MRVFLGTDHAGYAHKEAVKKALTKAGHIVTDCGAYQYEANDDYPDFIAPAVVQLIAAADTQARAVVFGGSGQGEAMVANRYQGARAVVYYGGQPDILTLSRAHNNANVLSLAARFLNEAEAVDATLTWLDAPFSKDERHVRRLQKVSRLKP